MKEITVFGNRIEVSFPYSVGLVNAVKRLPDRQWDNRNKVWWFPVTPFHLDAVQRFASEYKFIVANSFFECKNAKPAAVQVGSGNIRNSLYPFQVEGVEFMHKSGGNLILADDMGLGKTLETLAYLEETKHGRVLVVCPASVVYKWYDEFQKWLGITPQPIVSSKQRLLNNEFNIVSYGLATSMYSILGNFDTIILDECHYVSNPKALRTRAVKYLSMSSNYVIGLSGTPFLNRPIDLWSLMDILKPGNFPSWFQYAERYCDGHRTHWGYDTTGHSNEEELKARLSEIMIRRTKEEIKDQLPDITRSMIRVSIDTKEHDVAVTRYLTHRKVEDIQRLLITLGKAKVSPAVELAENIMSDAERKVVLYCKHLDVLELLKEKLKLYGVLVIQGSVSSEDRQKIINLFQHDDTYRVMIITSAGGEGIDLYRASDIIFVEREWNPGKEEQVESRLHRLGQKSPVTAYYLTAKETYDVDHDQLIQMKREIFHNILTNGHVDVEEFNVMDELIGRIICKGK
jgi:SWI/SNF-related matrix-associated actin-dependent regulator 1 of chromatin subfamily A